MEARLVAISGPLEGAVFPLDAELSIGREKTNSVPIEDRVLSRRHCLIQKDNGQFKVRDLNSSNGTYVNSLPIAAHLLKDVMSLVDPSVYVPVAVNCRVFPTANVRLAGVTAMDCSVTGTANTTSTQ